MVLEKVPCQIETYKQTTKSGSASSSSGGRSRLSSANDNSFLENDEPEDDSNQFEEKKVWQIQSQKNVVVKNAMEEMGWYWEHSRMDPESEKKSIKARGRGVITGLDEWQVSLMDQAFDDLMIPEPDQVISLDSFS
jgi:hypothetical protein